MVATSSDTFYDYEATNYTTVFDVSNQPVISYKREDGNTVHVERWDGSAWSPLLGEPA